MNLKTFFTPSPGRERPFLIQVAGALDIQEGLMLARAGADAVGLPLRLDHHKPDVSEAEAARIFSALPHSTAGVVITYERDPKRAAALCHELAVPNIQLHAPWTRAALEMLREIAPELFIIKSLIVSGSNLVELARQVKELSPLADAFITDTFDPESGACGATGKTHDWRVSRELVSLSPKPVVLAGGLGPDNVSQAINLVRPAGVDAHTGLEDEQGRKDPDKTALFIQNARLAARKDAGSPPLPKIPLSDN